MFDIEQKSTGTDYTTPIALLIIAFVLCPAVLVASRLILAVAGTLCVIMAWFNWTRPSRQFAPLMAMQLGSAR